MTENEAIKHLQSYAEVVDNMIKYCKDFEPKADITGYLEKKTVFAMAISAIKEIQQYREIGTVEECREAVKKRKLKTPGRTGMDEQDCYICPNCGADIGSIDDYFPRDRYCHECGQAIQWNENLEEMEDERD